MFNSLPVRLEFDSPGYLLLLLLVPVLWIIGYRTLSGLGKFRRAIALLLRTAVLCLLALAAAEMQFVQSYDKLTVIYLLDQSESIPDEQRGAMIDYVNAAILRHRRADDKAGVVVFGREAAVEIPPFDDNVQVSRQIESLLDPEFTNLAGALKLAQALFPSDTSKRIVIVSDGNQNMGDALDQARAAVDASIGIDVHPITYGVRPEVLVEKVTLPTDVRKGQPFDLRVVMNNTSPGKGDGAAGIRGKLIITEQGSEGSHVLSEESVVLPPGKKVFSVRREITEPDFYTYKARFVPEDPTQDAMQENNEAATFTHVRGEGKVLLIEDRAHKGEHGLLVQALKQRNLEVTLRSSDQVPTRLAEFQQFDTVILANVAREDFSDEQIALLAQNTQSMGSGLVMLGGENSFGAGGWTNTEVEKAMPLDFQIKSAKVVPKGALVMIMHASELAAGNYWQKVIAKKAIEAMGAEDYCGVLHWNGTDQWLWGGIKKVGGLRDRMMGALDRMIPGDMPDFDPAMNIAYTGFAQLTDAAAKHMIIISDGDPSPPSRGVVNRLKTLKVTVSTVAVGCHGPAESAVLQKLASDTGGKYYAVQNPRMLPKIFQREARRVARPLIHENPNGFSPSLQSFHAVTSGIDPVLPPITGYVMTSVKKNPLVEVLAVSPEPGIKENTSLIAAWTYGLGRSLAITTDAGERWAKSWAGWANYEKLFSQAVVWSMRPAGDEGKFTVATDVEDGQVKVFVTALDKNDEFLNFLDLHGAVLGPDLQPHDVKLEQTAPGRYVGAFDATDAGSYFLTLIPGGDQAPLRLGVDVPYSAEFRSRQADEELLRTLASLVPKGGKAGAVIRDQSGADKLDELLKTNTFRHDLMKATGSQDIWHYLLFAGGCLFFFDVLVRRVTVSLAWVPPMVGRLRDRLRGEVHAPPEEFIQRLRSRKAEVDERLEQRRAAARFEPQPDAPVQSDVVEQELGQAARVLPTSKPRPAAGLSPLERQEESYTERLLKAKKRVWKDRDDLN